MRLTATTFAGRPAALPRFSGTVILKMPQVWRWHPKAMSLHEHLRQMGALQTTQKGDRDQFVTVIHDTVEDSDALAQWAREAGVETYATRTVFQEAELETLLLRLSQIAALTAMVPPEKRENAMQVAKQLMTSLVIDKEP